MTAEIRFQPEGKISNAHFIGEPPKCENCGRSDRWVFEWGTDDFQIIAICVKDEFSEWCSVIGWRQQKKGVTDEKSD